VGMGPFWKVCAFAVGVKLNNLRRFGQTLAAGFSMF